MADSTFYATQPSRLDSPAGRGFQITTNDAQDLPEQTRALYVGNNGDVRLTTTGGDTFILRNVQSGTILPIRAVRVFATSTSATDIVGLF